MSFSMLEETCLIAEGVSADGDGLRPTWDKPGNVLADDWLTEDGAAQDVPDGSVGALPHLLQAELYIHIKYIIVERKIPQSSTIIHSTSCTLAIKYFSSPYMSTMLIQKYSRQVLP